MSFIQSIATVSFIQSIAYFNCVLYSEYSVFLYSEYSVIPLFRVLSECCTVIIFAAGHSPPSIHCGGRCSTPCHPASVAEPPTPVAGILWCPHGDTCILLLCHGEAFKIEAKGYR